MNTFNNTSRWLSTLAAIACTFTVGTAIAGPPADAIPSVTVSYADLDLASQAGAQVLYQRIKQAAQTVCAALASKQLERQALWHDCYEQAVANAVATIDRPLLTALHRAAVRTARG